MTLKTQPKPETIQRDWFIIDAENKTLGRLSSEVARILMGKHRAYYTPHWDLGDHIVVINAAKVRVTGKKETDKIYWRHTGYPGGIRSETVSELREKRPEEIIRRAVKGMMPKNRLAKQMIKKLHLYPTEEHPHKAQKPKELTL